ncbi:hypothetical protein [Sphingobacterium wenxiniae]|uniref:Uncharacterized protein n=1 Tax=Sphingobacterium wenxiniae TaxID=683125 RepID=A0A1I6NQZ1_9SPHI|nr:hypothetical protein [Sphingobacterium wenxiniae]SFS30315.1 hypothetical protein SAMN05660206_10117 [Sphingobacterium wenxiniae]
MKQMFIRLLATGSTFAAIAFGVYAYGCASDWWGPGYNSIFSPEITVNNKKYEPFFYDDYTTFYNGYSIERSTELFKEETIKEWTSYLEQYDEKTVAYYLYDKELTEVLADISQSKNLAKEWNKHVLSTYALDFSKQKTKNFAAFVLLSRGLETYSNQTYNYWDYNDRITRHADQDFVDEKERVYKKASKRDKFYKNRLWFQVLRAKFYSEDKASVIEFFEKTAKDQPKNSLYYQGLSYVAGAYKHSGNYKKSNALFSQIFDEFEPLMPAALFDYKPLPETEFEESVKLASNTSTKETLYALQGYYTNGFEKMTALYEINPASKHLDFLLSRWVNIDEQSINIYTEYATLDIIDAQKAKSELKSKVDASELQWINRAAEEQKVANPYIWKAAAAYFNSFVGDYQTSAKQLGEAYQLAKNEEEKAQVISLRLLNNLLSLDKIDKNGEEKLIADVTWLFYDPSNTEYDVYTSPKRINYLQMFTKKYLSAIYKGEGNTLMAELTYPVKGFFKDQNRSVAMEKLLLSETRTAWQDVFAGIYPYKLADIYESRGIYLFYEDKIEEAIAEFERITPFEMREYNWETQEYETKEVDYKTVELLGNPFNGKIKDCNDCDHKDKQPVKYSQLSFLKKVQEMKEKIAQDEDVYNNALLVGNAFYNTSYFGNARRFYYNNVIGEYGSNYIEEANKPALHNMENAGKYYELALKHVQNAEQGAKINYLLAKVERNDFYAIQYFSQPYFYPYSDNLVSFKAWKGFEELKQNYADTKYYQEVIKECGYFRKYVGME